MKLPHWLAHDWDKFGEKITETTREYNQYNQYRHTNVRIYQEHTCKTCGKIEKVLIESSKYYDYLK